MNSKYLAGISLAVMALGFVVTLFLPENAFVLLLQGGFEAGLVGGIADWFAVTALFRHPLGIPVPHTSLLLKNRDKIVQSLISAMENELLNKESIENKLRKLNILRVVSSQLTKQMSRKKVRRTIVGLLTQLVIRLPLEKAVPFIQSWISEYIRKADFKAAAEMIVTKAMNDGYDEAALDYVLKEASKWAERPETQSMLGKLASEKLAAVNMGGLMGFAFQAFAGFMNEEKLGAILQNMLLSGIRDLQTGDNAYRELIMREIRIQLFQLAENDAHMTSLKEWALKSVEGEGAGSFMQARLEDIRTLALGKLEEEQANGGRKIFALYRSTVRHLTKDPEWIEVWESRLLSSIIHLVESNHYRIGQLVKENLDQMDDKALVRMMEEKVGKDLQWIRVNGALCGFVVGIILALIQWI